MSGSRKKLASLFAELGRICGEIANEMEPGTVAVPSRSASRPVTDAELDGPHGNGLVRFNPRDWDGEPMKGKRWNECSPEFLDVLADTLNTFADRNTDPKKAGYDRRDAQRVAAWAARLRAGWKREERSEEPPSGSFDGDAPPSSGQPMGGFDDSPFDGGSGGWDE